MTGLKCNRRMTRLEDCWTTQESPCRSCGAPAVLMRWVVCVASDRPMPTCPRCQRSLDYDGTPLAPGAHCVMRGDR